MVSQRVNCLVPDMVQNDFEGEGIESIWLELFPSSKRFIMMCCAHRPPSSNFSLQALYEQCDMALAVSNHLLICGDLNHNLLEPKSISTKFVNSCHFYHLTELQVSQPHRLMQFSQIFLLNIHKGNISIYS